MIIDGHHHIETGHSHILERMDALGIDKTVLIGVGVSDISVVTIRDSLLFQSNFLLRTVGTVKMRSFVRGKTLQNVLLKNPVNDRVLDAIKAVPNRFLGFVFVNPESELCFSEIERCLDEGMCGIKLSLLQYPTNLAGRRMMKICEIASERKIPVFFHQGITKEAADPSRMINDFPDVTFIIAHAGMQYYREAIIFAKTKKNVYLDTSSWIVTQRKLKNLYRQLGAKKLVFGTDVPVMANDQSIGLNKIRNLQLSASEEELILGGNLRKILEIN